jgi:putative acetyltransferase
MQIRRAAPGDEEALAAIRRSSILALTAPALSSEQAEAWPSGIAADRMARALADHDVWVAVEAVAVGWVEVDRDRVAALYVSPSHARVGVRSHLLRHAEEAIRAAGHTSVRLEASENALAFYERCGYRPSGMREPDGSYPMTKDLAPAGQPGHDEPARAGVVEPSPPRDRRRDPAWVPQKKGQPRDAAQAITPDVRSWSISSAE